MAFQANAFQNDAIQIGTPCFSHTCFDPNCFYDDAGTPTPAVVHGGSFAEENKRKPRKSQKQRSEYYLNKALEKAFEPKRRVVIPSEPWLAEPVPQPVLLPIPEFNPEIANLSGYVADLQRQLAQRKFELSQMEADDELLLLSI